MESAADDLSYRPAQMYLYFDKYNDYRSHVEIPSWHLSESLHTLTNTKAQEKKSVKKWGMQELKFRDFPGSAVVKNLPANAGDTGLSPGLGRSHMPRSTSACVPQLLSLHSRACEPQLLKPMSLEPVLCNKRSHRNEKPTHCKKSSPCLPQLENARAQQRRPNAAKNK